MRMTIKLRLDQNKEMYVVPDYALVNGYFRGDYIAVHLIWFNNLGNYFAQSNKVYTIILKLASA